MSYIRTADLVWVAAMGKSRFDGITLQDLKEEFGCNHRTALCIMPSFDTVFLKVDVQENEFRRRPWHCTQWLQALGICDTDRPALKLAVERAERDGSSDEAQRLDPLRTPLLAAMPSNLANHTEADAEALPEVKSFATSFRPAGRIGFAMARCAVRGSARALHSRNHLCNGGWKDVEAPAGTSWVAAGHTAQSFSPALP